MRNALLFSLLLFFVSSPAISQADTIYHNAYERFEGWYGDLKKEGRKDRGFKVRNEFTILVTLSSNIYTIELKWPEKTGDSISWNTEKYVGNYSVNDQGKATLLNDHPFHLNSFTIIEQEAEMTEYGRIMAYTFSARLKKGVAAGIPRNSKFRSEKGIWMYETPSYGPGRYLPNFFPHFRSLWNIFNRDSVQEQLEALQPVPERSEMPPFSEINREKITITAFYVDSIVSDILYISRIQVYAQGHYRLTKSLKMQGDQFQVKEHAELYEAPGITNNIIYRREEIDDMRNLKLLDYQVDRYGLQWVKVEFDIASGHPQHPQLEHYDGYILQGNLDVY